MRHLNCRLCGSTRTSSKAGVFSPEIPYSVSRCAVCRSEWLDPIPGDATLKEFYRQYPHSEITWEYFLESVEVAGPMAERIVSSCPPPAAGEKRTFLDIGGASGFLAAAVAKRGWAAETQDISANSGKWISRANEAFGIDVRLDVMELGELAASGRKFDAVNASQVLEHVQDPEAFLKLMAGLVKPGGFLYIDTPNNEALFWEFKNRIRKRFNRMDFYNALRPPEHIWGYTKDGLRALAEKCGLEPVRITDYGLGDARYQPASAFWYLPMAAYLRGLPKSGFALYVCGKMALGACDRKFFSPCLRRGGGLSTVLRVL